MIKENQKYFNALHVILDAFIVFLSFRFAYFVRFTIFAPPKNHYFALFNYYYIPLLIIIPLYLFLYLVFHLYAPKRFLSRRFELVNIIKANAAGFLLIVLILFGTNNQNFSKWLLVFFAMSNIVFTFVMRNVIRKWLNITRKHGHNLKHIIIIGFSPAATSYIDRLKLNPQWGYRVHGIFDDNVDSDFEYRGIPWVGTLSDLNGYLSEHTLDETIITLDIKEYGKLEQIVSICEKSGSHTKFVPDYYNFITTRPYTEDLNGLPVINIRNVPLSNSINKIIKRSIDIFGALVALILFSPIMIVVALLVKLSSPGPIIFSQVRVGLHNKEFKMYKFRSMGVQKAKQEEKEWTTSNDPRVTPVGKFIRKTSLDELPQFFNVLKGDMSLIGPRPERPYFVEKFKEDIPKYLIKHQVRPGITGWAQVNGFRGDTSITMRIEHDIYYIENWSLGLDIKILFLTFFKGFVNENAY